MPAPLDASRCCRVFVSRQFFGFSSRSLVGSAQYLPKTGWSVSPCQRSQYVLPDGFALLLLALRSSEQGSLSRFPPGRWSGLRAALVRLLDRHDFAHRRPGVLERTGRQPDQEVRDGSYRRVLASRLQSSGGLDGGSRVPLVVASSAGASDPTEFIAIQVLRGGDFLANSHSLLRSLRGPGAGR